MKQKQPSHQEISARAYKLYVERGRLNGQAVDDWLQAEYELLQLPVRELAKLPVFEASRVKPKAASIAAVVRQAMLMM